MTLIQTNSTLLKVSDPGSTDEFRDTEDQPDAQVWFGQAPAYYLEKRERIEGAMSSVEVRRYLIVETDIPPVTFSAEQLVEFDLAGVTVTGTIADTQRRVLAEAGEIQTTRLRLEDE